LTVCPKLSNFRAQWWALPQASIPIKQGFKLTKNSVIWLRYICFFVIIFSNASMPWNWKTDFAKSIPITLWSKLNAPVLFSVERNYTMKQIVSLKVGVFTPLLIVWLH
jgi:hypothetical protein